MMRDLLIGGAFGLLAAIVITATIKMGVNLSMGGAIAIFLAVFAVGLAV